MSPAPHTTAAQQVVAPKLPAQAADQQQLVQPALPILTSTPKQPASGDSPPPLPPPTAPDGPVAPHSREPSGSPCDEDCPPLPKLLVTLSAAVIATAVAIPLVASCLASPDDPDDPDDVPDGPGNVIINPNEMPKDLDSVPKYGAAESL